MCPYVIVEPEILSDELRLLVDFYNAFLDRPSTATFCKSPPRNLHRQLTDSSSASARLRSEVLKWDVDGLIAKGMHAVERRVGQRWEETKYAQLFKVAEWCFARDVLEAYEERRVYFNHLIRVNGRLGEFSQSTFGVRVALVEPITDKVKPKFDTAR